MRGKFGNFIYVMALLLFLAGFLACYGICVYFIQPALATPQDIYEINANEIKEGMHIKGNIDFVYDYYAVESYEEKFMEFTTSTTEDAFRYYIMPVYGDSKDDMKLITVKINQEGYFVLDKIIEETLAYVRGESDSYGQRSYEIDVKAEKIDKRLLDLYYEWYGLDYKEEAESYLVPYVLVPTGDVYYSFLLLFLVFFWIVWKLIDLANNNKKC